jgi:hypothetical protein
VQCGILSVQYGILSVQYGIFRVCSMGYSECAIWDTESVQYGILRVCSISCSLILRVSVSKENLCYAVVRCQLLPIPTTNRVKNIHRRTP